MKPRLKKNRAVVSDAASGPEGSFSRGSNVTMLLEREAQSKFLPPATAGPPTMPVPLEMLISAGAMTITPELARRIREERNYHRQRQVKSFHVKEWSELLERGTFGQARQIWFAMLDGRLHLVDGQHRLEAVVETGIPATFQVCFERVRSEDALNDLYISFDRVQRPRTVPEMLNALGISEANGISKLTAAAVFKAALLLEFDFAAPHYSNDVVAVRNDDTRLGYAKKYWAVAARYEQLLEAAPKAMRLRLMKPSVLAVALATLTHQPERAAPFWRAIAENDGLRRGDPAHTFINSALARDFKAAAGSLTQLTARAWNAYYTGSRPTHFKAIDGARVRILGTPFGKAGK